jgi:hypothetical protein
VGTGQQQHVGVIADLGDGGPATSAEVGQPTSIVVDRNFNLFLADTERIREVSGGIITTIAGDGHSGPVTDGPAADAHFSWPLGLALNAAGDLYIADSYNHCVRKLSHGIITTVAGGGAPNWQWG